MQAADLEQEQWDAVNKLKNGSILCGGVGSGKSRTSLAYYEKNYSGKPLYIITTARKRDTLDWEGEAAPFDIPIHTVDSWNNIEKYVKIEGAFFIFDEQRVVGYGAWTKAFLSITKKNKWILLSATPGDRWIDYIPVFIANGFYKHKTAFTQEHVIYNYHMPYPVVDRYVNEGKLMRLRNDILVNINYKRTTTQHHYDVYCSYSEIDYMKCTKTKCDPKTGELLENATDYCYTLRKIVNSSPGRQVELLDILVKHPKAIIFYNFDYELDILRSTPYDKCFKKAEWNGHKHEPVPTGDYWVYFVQYTAGAEGWNCVTTDTMIFYSQSYSYKAMVQASGRIDRRNTKFKDLYYYHLISKSNIDNAIKRALKQKKEFNVRSFADLKGERYERKNKEPGKFQASVHSYR